MYIAVPDMLGEFSISETGGTDGAEGDQTGYESRRGAFYDYPWNGILECVCTATDGADTGHEDKQVIVNATVQDNSGADYMRLKFECVDDAEQIYRITDKENGYFMTAAANAANANVDFRSFSCGKYQMWRMLKKRYLKADYTMFECVATPGLYLSVENNGIGGKNNLSSIQIRRTCSRSSMCAKKKICNIGDPCVQWKMYICKSIKISPELRGSVEFRGIKILNQ